LRLAVIEGIVGAAETEALTLLCRNILRTVLNKPNWEDLMSESHNKQHERNPEYVTIDKSADILQATFKHYFEMAMDHHTKAATTSNILLIIVGALIGLVGLDNTVGGMVDFVSGLTVLVIGLFGAVWAWKQHERYHYWEHIAYEYQKELIKIMPELKTAEDGGAYDLAAQDETAKKFWPLFAKGIRDRYLWVTLHGFVVVTGIVLMVVSI
jgi:hypothetical protein